MGDEVHRVKKVRKKKNFLLTNSIKYDILDNVKGRWENRATDEWFPRATPSTREHRKKNVKNPLTNQSKYDILDNVKREFDERLREELLKEIKVI